MPLRQTTYIFCLFTCCLLFLGIVGLHAQGSVWGTGAVTKKAGKGISDSKKKLKDYKKQLQEWGMDNNYTHELLLGGKVNSNGWSGAVQYLTKQDKKTNTLWQFSFSEIKHDKQIKITGTSNANPQLGNNGPFIFGKINNLYALQLGWGKEKILLPGLLDGDISVSLRYNGGFSLAMLKPYYLKLVYTDANNVTYLEQQKYSESNSEKFLNSGSILGASTWSKGLDEIDYVPGAYIESCVVIQPGKNKSFIEVVTLGINAAFYAKDLPIMADQKAYPYQASLFAGIGLGKRW